MTESEIRSIVREELVNMLVNNLNIDIEIVDADSYSPPSIKYRFSIKDQYNRLIKIAEMG